MVLLVVDAQKALVTEELYECGKFVQNIRLLIEKARKTHTEVVYVVHDDGAGSSLTWGTAGFEVFEAFKPQEKEKVFVKRVNSAFRDTGLTEYLTAKGQKEVMVAGLQTDKCINATVIGGFERGFRMIVPAFANSTVDNAYMDRQKSCQYFNEFMWPGRYAQCVSMEEALQKMEQGGGVSSFAPQMQ